MISSNVKVVSNLGTDLQPQFEITIDGHKLTGLLQKLVLDFDANTRLPTMTLTCIPGHVEALLAQVETKVVGEEPTVADDPAPVVVMAGQDVFAMAWGPEASAVIESSGCARTEE